MGCGVHQQRAAAGTLQLRQAAEHAGLNGATPDGIEIGHVAPLGAEALVEGADQSERIADAVGRQQGPNRLIARALTGPSVELQADPRVQEIYMGIRR